MVFEYVVDALVLHDYVFVDGAPEVFVVFVVDFFLFHVFLIVFALDDVVVELFDVCYLIAP